MKTFVSIAFIFVTVLLNAAIPPPYQPNAFSTNVAGNPVLSQNNISITNVGSTTNWEFFNVGPRTVARLEDVTNAVTSIAGNVTNALSIISSNGVVVASGVTNLDFIDGTNIAWKITNAPSGDVDVAAHMNPAVWINASNLTFQIATACSNLSYQIGSAASNLAYVIGANGTNYTDSRSVNSSNLSYTIGANGTNYTDASVTALSNNVNGAFIKNLNGLGTNTTIHSALGGPSIALTVDTNVLVVTNGSVGIRTNNPIRIFHVRNDPATPVRVERASSSPIAGHVEMYNSDTTDGNAVSFDFLSDSTGVGASPGIAFGTVRNLLTTHDHATRAGDMTFLTLSPSGNTEKVRIKSLGQVGIGTNNPQARLHVVGDGTKDNLLALGTTLLDTNFYITTNGVVNLTAPAFTTATSALTGPAENELVAARWVRSLFSGLGQIYYNGTNIDSIATNINDPNVVFEYQSDIPSPNARTYTVTTITQYIGQVITTNRFQNLVGPVTVNSYMSLSNSSGGRAASVKAEIYYSYDRTNWFGDFDSAGQNITTGTNLYQYVVSFPTITSTNAAGFYVQRRLKTTSVGAAVQHVRVLVGTNHASFLAIPVAPSSTTSAAAVSVSSNGVNLTTAATNLNFVNAPLMTNSTGDISIDLASQPPITLASLLTAQTLFDEFLYVAGSGTISALPPFGWQAGNSGGSGGLLGGETNAPGIWRMSSGGTAGNLNHINTVSTSSGGFGAFALGNIAMTNTWRVRVNPMPTIADGGKYVWGFGDTTPNVVFGDGVWFQIDTNRFNWVCLCASNAVVVGVTNLTTFPTNNTWYTLTITIDELATVASFYVNGTLIATNPGTLPMFGSGALRTVGLVAGAKKEAGATSMTNDVDYCYLSYRLNAVR